MKTNLKISVVIPVKNEGENILEAIQSLTRQTLKPHEIIVVDDKSTDDTVDLASRAGAKVIQSAGRLPAAAMNTGIKHASGEVIAFIDGDEVATPQWTEAIIACLEKCSAEACTGPVLPHKESSIWSCAYHLPSLLHLKSKKCSRASYLLAGNMAARRHVFEMVGLFDEAIWSQDREFHTRLLAHGIQAVLDPEMQTRHKGHDSFWPEVRALWSSANLRDMKGFRRHGLRFYSYIRLRHYLPHYLFFLALAILPFLLGAVPLLGIVLLASLALAVTLLVVHLHIGIKVKLKHKTTSIIAFMILDALSSLRTLIIAIAAPLLP